MSNETSSSLSPIPNRPLHDAILIAVWPGMGQIAATAGYYLMSQLGMQEIAEFPAKGLFDVDSIQVQMGVVQRPQRPRNRIFSWLAPEGQRDLLVFIGEAQPPLGKYEFCERLLDCATSLGATEVVTFAAMASGMAPGGDSRVFVVATSEKLVDEFSDLDCQTLDEGSIGGMNGVLLGVAADLGLPGTCLLGEMPHTLVQLTYPKAVLAVLKVFLEKHPMEIDLDPLVQHAEEFDHQLEAFMREMKRRQSIADQRGEAEEGEEESEDELFPMENPLLSPEDEKVIEELFEASVSDRAKAYELKRELDRLGVFSEYEDRFLDLFRKRDE